MAFDRGSAQTTAMFPKLLSLFRIVDSGKRISEIVFRSRNPLRRDSKAELDLSSTHPPGHLESKIFAGSAVPKEVPTSLVICVNGNLGVLPQVTPQVESNDVGEQLEIRN